jgi:ADP-ribose pyrophosphatase YjhB (NUDIX family)
MPAVTIPPMPRTPDITVAAIAQTAGRFLFVEERINNRLVFNQPAGHVEQGESLLAAVIREVREETAWHFEPQGLLGVYLWRRPSARRATLRFAFTGAVSDHHAHQRLDRGIVRTHWLSESELLAHEERLRSPLVLRCVRDFLSGGIASLDSVAQLDLESAATVAPTARL